MIKDGSFVTTPTREIGKFKNGKTIILRGPNKGYVATIPIEQLRERKTCPQCGSGLGEYKDGFQCSFCKDL